MAATTIKVSGELRDRLNAEARAAGGTVAQVIESLIAERDRLQRFRRLRRDMAAMSVEELRDYQAEVRAWDPTLVDGLGPDERGVR